MTFWLMNSGFAAQFGKFPVTFPVHGNLPPPAQRRHRRNRAGGLVAGGLVDPLKSISVLLSKIACAMTDETAVPTATLDATGLLCPLPVLKARRALKPLPSGAVLEVLATDPGAVKDFEHFCQTTGCRLLELSEEPGGVLRFRLKKPG